jgi:hypothetical protein
MTVGPLLEGVLEAQREDAEATAFPRVESYCAALEALCEELGSPVVWPVGPAAERLAGAAVIWSRGRIRVRDWSSATKGDRVLLLAVAAVSPLPINTAAEHARALGAAEVRACGVAVQDADSSHLHRWIGAYAALDPDGSREVAASRGQLQSVALR